MLGTIHFEAIETGLGVQTHLRHVSSFDKVQILCTLTRSLRISKKEFEMCNALVQSGLDKLMYPDYNTTEVSVPSEVLEMIEKMKGDNHDEG